MCKHFQATFVDPTMSQKEGTKEGGEGGDDSWDDFAEGYAAMKEVDDFATFYSNVLLRQPWFKKNTFTVLDFGCGPANALLKIAKKISHGVGYDLSAEMIKIARKNAKAQGVDDVLEFHQLEHADGKDIEAESKNPYDVVICAFVLHHVGSDENRAAILARLAQATKSGGHLMICEFSHDYGKGDVDEMMKEQRVEMIHSETFQMEAEGKTMEAISCIGRKP